MMPFYFWPKTSDQTEEIRNVAQNLSVPGPIRWWLKILFRVQAEPKLWLCKRMLQFLLFYNQFVYMVLNFCSIHFLVPSMLAFIELQNPELLAYKALYYGLMMQKLGNSVTTIYLLAQLNERDWPTFAKYTIFSLSPRRQLFALLAPLISLLPDILLSWCDTIMMITYFRVGMDAQQMFKDILLIDSPLGVLLNLLVMFMSSANVILRHRAIVQVTYVQICCSNHLSFLESQLILANKNERLEATRPSVSRRIQIESVEQQNEKQQRQQQQQKQQHEQLDNFKLINLRQIYDLERNFLQIDQMVDCIDRVGPFEVLTQTILNCTFSMLSALFCVYIPREMSKVHLSVMYVFSRSMPLFVMFISGGLMRRRSRDLIKQLELRFLGHSGASLIYKQLGSSSDRSLLRVFKLLEQMGFHCDGLMDINYRTLGSMLTTLPTFFFVILQCDMVLNISKK